MSAAQMRAVERSDFLQPERLDSADEIVEEPVPSLCHALTARNVATQAFFAPCLARSFEPKPSLTTTRLAEGAGRAKPLVLVGLS
jgi:hypothetical protein